MADDMRSLMNTYLNDFVPHPDYTPAQSFQAYVDHFKSKHGTLMELRTTPRKVDFRTQQKNNRWTLFGLFSVNVVVQLAVVIAGIVLTLVANVPASEDDELLQQLEKEGINVQAQIYDSEATESGYLVTVHYHIIGKGDYEAVFAMSEAEYEEAHMAEVSAVLLRYLPDDPRQVRWVEDWDVPTKESDLVTRLVILSVVFGGMVLWRIKRQRQTKAARVMLQTQQVAVLRLPHHNPNKRWVYAVVVLGQNLLGGFEHRVGTVFLPRPPRAVPDVGVTVVM